MKEVFQIPFGRFYSKEAVLDVGRTGRSMKVLDLIDALTLSW